MASSSRYVMLFLGCAWIKARDRVGRVAKAQSTGYDSQAYYQYKNFQILD